MRCGIRYVNCFLGTSHCVTANEMLYIHLYRNQSTVVTMGGRCTAVALYSRSLGTTNTVPYVETLPCSIKGRSSGLQRIHVWFFYSTYGSRQLLQHERATCPATCITVFRQRRRGVYGNGFDDLTTV